jgi:hypothetical protein
MGTDSFRIEQKEPGFYTRQSIRDFQKIGGGLVFLAMQVERAVVGRNDI